jgi:hypothetical protein
MISLEVRSQQEIPGNSAAIGNRAREQGCILACTEDVIGPDVFEASRRACHRFGETHQLRRVGPFGGLADQFDAVSELGGLSHAFDQATRTRGKVLQIARVFRAQLDQQLGVIGNDVQGPARLQPSDVDAQPWRARLCEGMQA